MDNYIESIKINSKKKIGFLINNMSNGGGTERVVSIIANGLFERGYEVSIISCRKGEYTRYTINSGIQLLSLNGENINNAVLRKWKSFNRLKNIVEEKKIDIMIAVDVALYIYLFPLHLIKKCKCIAWEHFNYYISPNYLVDISRKLGARFADCTVVLGKQDKENYEKNLKYIKKIETIYNPIALDLSGNADITKKRIIAIGRLEKQKGFDLLIEIWRKLENGFPEWTLDIYGEGSLHNELQNKIDIYDLKQINLCGYTSNVEHELLNSSIFALTSRYEGFGLVLIEAQAKGVPCISFNCNEGPQEIIDDGVNGYLIEKENIDEFVEKLGVMMREESLRKEFSANTKKDLSKFAPETILDKWNLLLVELLNQGTKNV